jgi:hypothetical protein
LVGDTLVLILGSLAAGETFPSLERRKTMEASEELSILLSGWLCSQCRA